MSTIQIFDPALCCPTGVCGTDVDPMFAKAAADLDWAKEEGIAIERFNLAMDPQAFAANAVVKAFLERSGEDALPLILVDGEMMLAGRYPNRAELSRWAGVSSSKLNPVPAGNCCSGGHCG